MSTTTITTKLATPDLWADVQHALTGGGDGASCQCQWWRLTNNDYNNTTLDDRRNQLQAEIDTGPPPGLVAYVDGQPAGWTRIGPRTNLARLPRTKNIAPNTPEPLDDPTVWTVTCFVIRREHRRLGLTSHLLEAAIDHARDRGARLIEAYPTDTSTGKHNNNDLYMGTLNTYLAAGFTPTGQRKPGRPIVALELQP